MEAEKYICPGCGASLSANQIDRKTRTGTCHFCGLTVRFAKKHSANSPSVQVALEEGVRLFLAGNFDSARSCAENVLTMSRNNAAALFIVNYYRSYAAEVKDSRLMASFFRETWDDCLFEVEEEEFCKQMILKSIMHSGEFEKEILSKFNDYDDASEITEFTESFSPMLIMRQKNIDWFTPEMAEIYQSLTDKTNLPKTWYALYAGITKNPDSPYPGNQFFLKTKTQRFYHDYVLRVGQIFSHIKDPVLKQKYGGAYLKAKADIESKMK